MSSKRTPSAATLREYKQRLLRVLIYIQQHLDETIGLEDLAAVACLSPFHFHRVFKGMTGESLMGHIRRLRLERAATELTLGKRPVIEVAFRAGYETHEAFTRAFKSVFGLAPIHFRAQGRSVTVNAVPSGVHFQANQTPKGFKSHRTKARQMNVQIKWVDAMRVAFVRHLGPYQEVGKTWEKFLPLLGKEGWIGGDTVFLGICHDDPDVTPADKVRYDACVTVDDRFVPSAEMGVKTVAEGEYAVATHFGSYDGLGRTYTRLFGQWLPRSGRELRNCPCFEVYLNSPESTDQADLLTDIYVPLQSRGPASRKESP